MTMTTIGVPGIHCDHCKMSIEGAVGKLDGVTSATVSVPDRAVTVDYDEGRIDVAAIRTAIEDQGYDVG